MSISDQSVLDIKIKTLELTIANLCMKHWNEPTERTKLQQQWTKLDKTTGRAINKLEPQKLTELVQTYFKKYIAANKNNKDFLSVFGKDTDDEEKRNNKVFLSFMRYALKEQEIEESQDDDDGPFVFCSDDSLQARIASILKEQK